MSNHSPVRKRGLGRGLGALIRSTEAYNPDNAESSPASRGIQQLPIEQIQPNPRQPRVQFDEDALGELAASIRAHGIIQPLIVTLHPDEPNHYHLVAGERRWRAARQAGLESVPAIVREVSPSQLVEWALIENVQRADLNALEEAGAYQSLIDEFGLTQDEVAERVGKSRPAIGNAVRLLELPAQYQAAVMAGQISAGHARALLRLKEKSALIEQAFSAIVRQGLSVRQSEMLVGQLLDAAETTAAAPEPLSPVLSQLAHLEHRLRSALGTRVNLSRNANGGGRLVIHFYGDDDLAHIYERITGGDDAG
jgi:ParB family chromosome partitioning protein